MKKKIQLSNGFTITILVESNPTARVHGGHKMAPLLNCEKMRTLLIREAAADLRCSKSQIYSLIDQKALRVFSISAGKKTKKFRQRVLSESVLAFLNKEIRR